MKKLAVAAAALIAVTAFAQVYVSPHVRSDGVLVPGHWRSAPDGNVQNNYGTQGNINPYTGQAGTVNPYTPPQPYGGGIVQQPAHPFGGAVVPPTRSPYPAGRAF